MKALPAGHTRRAHLSFMNAQRVATGVGLAALAGLLMWVGLPALSSPPPVSPIRIDVPAGQSTDDRPGDDGASTPTAPAIRGGDDDADDAEEPGSPAQTEDPADDDEPDSNGSRDSGGGESGGGENGGDGGDGAGED